MLAWSSISQIGYIVLAAGLGTPLAMAGALLHFFNHATFKSLLFVNSATVEAQTGVRIIFAAYFCPVSGSCTNHTLPTLPSPRSFSFLYFPSIFCIFLSFQYYNEL
jgi:NADH:ubiquinone oxidoreductase subunit 2 (subunit N)